MEPKIIKIKTIKSLNGDISIIDRKNNLPFEIKRIFYVHNIPQDSERGGHAHKTLEQFIWAINGILEVKAISQSMKKFNYVLKSPYEGLYLPPMIWSNQFSRSKNSIYCVAASDYYAEKDYIRDWEKFSKSLISKN